MEKLFKPKKLILVCFFFCSCASLLNKKNTYVNITADKKSKIIFKNDTISLEKKITIYPTRSKKTIKLKILQDSLKQTFFLNRKLSATYLGNIFILYGIGYLIDLHTDKRFGYRKNIYLKTDSINNKILVSNKKIAFIPQKTLLVYTYPLENINPFSVKTPIIGIEYFFKKNLSFSAAYGFSNRPFFKTNRDPHTLKEKAKTFRIETKFYNLINLTKNTNLNEYFSFEYRQINSQYNNSISYFDNIDYEGNFTTNTNLNTDFFGTFRQENIVNLKYGLFIPIKQKFYFDFYTGIGFRTKNFNYVELEYDREIHLLDDTGTKLFSTSYTDFKNYNRKSFFNYALGFKFGYKF